MIDKKTNKTKTYYKTLITCFGQIYQAYSKKAWKIFYKCWTAYKKYDGVQSEIPVVVKEVKGPFIFIQNQ